MPSDASLNEYVVSMPSHQNAIDAIPGWNQALPPHTAVTAGRMALYNDPRILWALDQFGDIEGRTVLELGPLEASHTSILNARHPSVVHAVEANKLAFFRCLVVKEILGLERAKFFLGDFVKWLEQRPDRYDLIIASGVLYHMQDPLHLLELICERTDSFYLWTHYMDEAAMPPADPRRSVFAGEVEMADHRGQPVRTYRRRYHGAWRDRAFCGGMHDLHRWIERADLLAVIAAAGFDDIRTADDQPDHPNGPSFSIFARRTPTRA